MWHQGRRDFSKSINNTIPLKPLLIVAGNEQNSPKALKILRKRGISFLFIPCWKTMVKIPEEIVDYGTELAEHIGKIDKTFQWKGPIRSYHRDVKMQKCKLLVIYSPTKDQAYRRGAFFFHRLKLKKIKRIKKGYYRVKKYPSNLHAINLQTGKVQGEDEIISEIAEILTRKLDVKTHRNPA